VGQDPFHHRTKRSLPPRKATKVDGGYRLSGRWMWGTVVMHAAWIMLQAFEEQAGGPPIPRKMMIPAGQAKVIDTWHMAGMAATGSNDIVVEDVFVPEGYQFDIRAVRNGRGAGREIYGDGL
jgi:alkylation response protein AidB-like acyl-CoA dehydrogenase